MPFKIAEKMCEKSIISPSVLEQSILMPTEPYINIGPLFEVKVHIFIASFLVMWPEEYRSDTTFAPTGYPLKIETINA